MRTPDDAWRVEIVRRGATRWYRLVHGDAVLDWLSIAAVERLLEEAGVDRSTLVPFTVDEAQSDPAGEEGTAAHGAA